MAVRNESLDERSKRLDFDSRHELEQALFVYRQLLNVAIVVGSTLDIEELLERISYSLFGQIQTSKVAIFQRDWDKPVFRLTLCKGCEDDENLPDIEIPASSPIVKYLEKELKALPVSKLTGVPELKDFLNTISFLEPEVVSPLYSKEQVNGVLIIGSKLIDSEYTIDDLDFITHLSNLSGLAISNALLYEMAVKDRMTKLYHQHSFKEKLKSYIEYATQTSTPLSLIMIDIDNFKKVNDTYGHLQGDVILIHLAKILSDKCKEYGYIPARYGGEEFSIILPKTPLDKAYTFAESLRKAVEEYPFPKGDEIMHITISLGVCQYKEGEHSEVFIKRTDEALYVSKRTGKNKVTKCKS